MLTTSRDCLTAALEYAKRGWRVFPLNGKVPYQGTHGHRDATTNAKQIRRWWQEWPNANVGIACDSQSGPIVVDIDGPTGAEFIASLDLPTTREASSGKATKRHLYFDPMEDGSKIKRTIKLQPEKDGAKLAVDVLGDGGYVVAPPSIHPETGRRYKWIARTTPAPLPEEIAEAVRITREARHGNGKGPAPPLPSKFGSGERDDLLTSLAGTMRRRGASEDAILAALREENQTRCDPPLEDKQLRKIARSIATKKPQPKVENKTDLGNARRFVTQHAAQVRNIAGKYWLAWDGFRWARDDTGEVDRLAKATVRSIYGEAAALANDDERDALTKWAAKSEDARRISAMLKLASTEPELCVTADQLDADPWVLNCTNGTIDLRTGKLRAHSRADLLTKLVPVAYDVKAKAPRWESFLLEVMKGNAAVAAYLQRAVGYALTGDTREQCLFFCYGKGANGKSTFFEVLRLLLGDYGRQTDFTSFMSRSSSDGPRNDLARMKGARLVTASEAPSDKGFDETTLKRLTGDDTIVARRLYEDFIEFKPEHKIFLAANHKPIVKEQTPAFWRRMRLIPFTRVFAPEERDKKLDKTLRGELPGVLAWAVRGCLAWQHEGLGMPKAVARATHDYQEENDLLGEFIAQRCSLAPTEWCSTVDLFRAFTEWWIETRGQRSASISMGWFGRMLGERVELKPTKKNQIRGWRGIGLRTLHS